MGKSAQEVMENAIFLHHHASGHMLTSPQSYINLLHRFKQILLKTVATSGGQSKHLLAGLEKLEEAKMTVDTLSREAGQKQALLGKKQKEASEAMKRIQVSME